MSDKVLKNEMNYYRTIFENSKDALLILKNRIFIDCNEAALELLAYESKDQVLATPPSELSPPYQSDGRESFEKAQEMMDLAIGKGSHRFVWTHKKADGTDFPVEVLLTTLSSEPDGEMIYTSLRDISAQQRALDNVFESNQQFESLMQQSPFILELYNLNGLQIDVNKAYEEMWGFSADTTVNKFNVLKSKEVKESGLYEYVVRAYNGEAVTPPIYSFDPTGETEANGPGRLRWLSTKIYPLRNIRGEVSNIVISHEDVTKIHQTHQELQFSEERFRSLVETTSDFIWEVDKNGCYSYVSPQVRTILGVEPDIMLGKTPFDFMAEDEKKHLSEKFRDYLQTQLPIENLENINIHKDGRGVILETSAVPFTDSNGEFAGYRGIDRDISTRKIYEEQLLLTESVFKNSIEGIAVTDESGMIQKVNTAFSRITGYSEEEALGQNPRILKSDRHDELFYARMWSDLVNKDQWSGEIWNRKKDGTAYPEWLTIAAIKDDKGKTTNYISLFHDTTEDKRKEEKMEFLAFHDPLTKLPNRRLFYDRLSISIESARRSKLFVALLYIDIDNFKDINDTYGHPFGDDFLCAVKEHIASICRKSDTFARYGGDEFVIVLNAIDSHDKATEFSDRLLNLFKEPITVKDELIYTSLSIGLTIFPDDGEDIVTLEKNADLALYKAKREGKKQTFQYRKELDDLAQKRNSLNTGLRVALTDFKGFSIDYQPKINIKTNKIYGFEALIRWQLEGKNISPDQFIPLAEETNLIIPLGKWILKKAMHDMKQIHLMGYDDVVLSINLSTRQFTDEHLFDNIEKAISETGYDRSKLIFEITESTSVNDIEHSVSIMENFKKKGFSLSIDDFGTGYSSLSYLKRFPLEELKIDKSFISDIPDDPNDVAICRTIISMANSLNYLVVAEGVETKEQLDFLSANGCFIIQGYYFYKPMAIDQAKMIFKDFI